MGRNINSRQNILNSGGCIFILIGGVSLSKWHCELFNEFDEHASKYSYIELGLWIIKCRQFVLKPDDDKEIKNYQNQVYTFFCEWEKHYDKNKKVYESVKFKKALLFVGRKGKLRFFIDFGKEKHDITDVFYNSLQNNAVKYSPLTDKTKKLIIENLNEDIFETDRELKDCFLNKDTFKSKFDKLIRKQYFYEIQTNIRFFKNEKWLKAASFEEFISVCENIDNYDIEAETKRRYSSYIEAIEMYDVPSTIYNDYMSKYKSEIAYDKKVFINLAFLLSLPKSYAKKLLCFNGYSITDSIRLFDILCEKAFRIGFGRDYFIVLIDKFNDDRQEQSPKYVQIQNITKAVRNKN